MGLSLVTLIDNRLSKVSITLPSQEHVIKLDENKEAIDNFDRALDLNSNEARSFDYRFKAIGNQP